MKTTITLNTTKRTRLKKAFSMIELIISIAVIGVLSAVVMQNKDALLNAFYENRESNNIVMLQMTVQDNLGGKIGYSDLSNRVIRGFNSFPSSMEADDPNMIKTTWSEYGVVLSPERDHSGFGFGSNSHNAFSMTYHAVPASSCLKLITNHESLFYKIEVNGSSVKDHSSARTSGMGSSGEDVAVSRVAQACGMEPDVNTIKFFSR